MNSLILNYVTVAFVWIKLAISMSPSRNILYSTDESIGDIVNYIVSKGYLPQEKELPRASLVKNNDNSATYLLSRLSDEELLKLLTEHPNRNEYSLNDIMRIASNKKVEDENSLPTPREFIQSEISNNLGDSSAEKKRFNTVTNNEPQAHYRLNNMPVESNRGQNDANYIALQKLKSLLNVYPQSKMEVKDDDNDDKKELIFDILVAQLKTLCCKRPKKRDSFFGQHKTIAEDILPSLLKQKNNEKYGEFMFLIINDEVKSNGSDELIDVDPESLDENSSVLLLGPVTSPLNDDQLKLVMNRISKELTKPEYLSLLQQLSNGMLNKNNKSLMKDFVFGPRTRRFIKPHRCNHQSKLAKVYGGPKWIICTGYLNINKPSLYD